MVNRITKLGVLVVLSVAVSTVAIAQQPPHHREVSAAVEQANAEIWRRFVDEHGILLDFTDLDGTVKYPTPEECRAGKPNALGWWSPIENGAMFNGLYLDAALLRWQRTQAPADANRARRLIRELLTLNAISDVKGFVGRGVSTDGQSHYAMGSNDQTLPWLVGLWRYWQSPLATAKEKEQVARHLTETIAEIRRLDWKMPVEAPFGTRDSFNGFHFDEGDREARQELADGDIQLITRGTSCDD